MTIAIYSIIVAVCLFFSSFLSAYETALTWVNRHRVKSIAKQNSPEGKRAARVYKLKDSFTSSLTVILIWNNVFNIVATTLLNLMFLEVFANSSDIALSTTIGVVVSTVLIIIFGEIIPKNLAFRNAEKYAIKTVNLMLFFKYALYPLVFAITKVISKTTTRKVNEKEILEVIDTSESEGLLEHNEKELIEAAISIKEKRVDYAMIPWTKVHSIRVKPKNSELMSIIKDKNHYSRLPVFNQSKTKVIGFIKMKDVYRKVVLEGKKPTGIHEERINLEELCFAPLFVRETDYLLDVLEILQQKKLHIAVVISGEELSNGSKAKNDPLGIITLEDVIEELIGEIYDEHDEIHFNEPVSKVGLDKFHIRGDVSFSSIFLNYLTETNMPEGDFKTFYAWVKTVSNMEIKKGFIWEYENLIISFHKKIKKSVVFEVTEKTTISSLDLSLNEEN